jgi:phosphoribosyl-dephospho-CoA transferase
MAEVNLPPERHRMIWVAPDAWAQMLEGQPDLANEPLIAEWASAGWPLVGRRAVCGDVATMAPLGLPLPPMLGRRRVALNMPFAAIVSDAPPPLLKTVAVVAPSAWQQAIASLLEVDEEVRCFGSLAWQYLTGLPYMTDSSDLDLLWRAGSADYANALTSRLALIAQSAPMRIDGELVTPSGFAVQWGEWRSLADQLLAKGADGIQLIEREALLR